MYNTITVVPVRRGKNKTSRRCTVNIPDEVAAAFDARAKLQGKPLAALVLDLAWAAELSLQLGDRRAKRATVLRGGIFYACSNVPFESVCHLERAAPDTPACPFEIGPYECTLGRGHRPVGLHVSHGEQGEILAAWDEER